MDAHLQALAEFAGVDPDELRSRHQALIEKAYLRRDDLAGLVAVAFSLRFAEDTPQAAYASALAALASGKPPTLPSGRTAAEAYRWVLERSALEDLPPGEAVDAIFGEAASPEPEPAPRPEPKPAPSPSSKPPEPPPSPPSSPAPSSRELGRLRAMVDELNRAVPELRERLDRLERELKGVKEGLKGLPERVAKLEEAVSENSEFANFISQLQNVDGRVKKLEDQFGGTLEEVTVSMRRLLADYRELHEFYEEMLPAIAEVDTRRIRAARRRQYLLARLGVLLRWGWRFAPLLLALLLLLYGVFWVRVRFF